MEEKVYYKNHEITQASKYEKYASNLLTNKAILYEGLDKFPVRNDYDKFIKRLKVCGWDDNKLTEEERFCECLVHNKEKDNKCLTCSFYKNSLSKPVVGAKFLSYAVPVQSTSKEIGDIDLIMEYENILYAVEFKGYWNKESVLRMFCEIETYYYLANRDKSFQKAFPNIQKAIMFMSGSTQQMQITGYTLKNKKYNNEATNTKKLLQNNEVTVFMLEDVNNEYHVKKIM